MRRLIVIKQTSFHSRKYLEFRSFCKIFDFKLVYKVIESPYCSPSTNQIASFIVCSSYF
jgi:hypothetical protein